MKALPGNKSATKFATEGSKSRCTICLCLAPMVYNCCPICLEVVLLLLRTIYPKLNYWYVMRDATFGRCVMRAKHHASRITHRPKVASRNCVVMRTN